MAYPVIVKGCRASDALKIQLLPPCDTDETVRSARRFRWYTSDGSDVTDHKETGTKLNSKTSIVRYHSGDRLRAVATSSFTRSVTQTSWQT